MHKQIRFRLLKHLADIYEEALGRLDFPNYHNFENINDPYSNFIKNVLWVIDLAAPIKSRQIKKTHKNDLTVKLQKKISVCDKILKKSKKSKHHSYKKMYKITRYEVQKLILYKKKILF